MQPRRTQNQLILSELKSNPTGISSIEAFSKYGITRLSARIYDLRPFPPENSDAAEIPFAAVA